MLGEQFQKIFGEHLDVAKVRGEMLFERERAGTPFLKLTQAQDAAGASLIQREHSVRFMEKGKIAGSAFRHEMPLDRAEELFQTTIGRPTVQRFMGVRVPEFARPAVEEFAKFKKSQYAFAPNVPHVGSSGIDAATELQFLPIYGKTAGDSVARQAFERAKFAGICARRART